MGHAAQGGRIAAPIFKQWAQTALKDQPKIPFVAPAGIRWVRIDRATGKRVYGVFPVTEDPKSPIIWEAFQPQTEPRRTYRRSTGDPYDQDQQAQIQRDAVARALALRRSGQEPTRQSEQPDLPTQNTL
jgi:penicillin-binding protein 1A